MYFILNYNMLIILFFIFSSAPDYFGNMMLGEEEVVRAIKGEEAKDQKEVKDLCSKLWEVEDVLQSRGEGAQKELLVKWKGYEEMTWVSWAANPGLASYLIHSQASPFASTLTKENLLSYEPECEEIMALRGAIFDKLFYRTTAAGDVGVSPAIVEIPFSRSSLQEFLGKGVFYGRNIDFSGRFPISFRCERWELDACFASTEIGSTTWYERTFDTTTSCVVDPNSPLSISWGYRVREQHIHSLCPRCSHKGEEINRPSICQTETVCLPGPPWIKVSFKKIRVNRIAVSNFMYLT